MAGSRLYRRQWKRGADRRARRPVGAVSPAVGHDPYRRAARAGDFRSARRPGPADARRIAPRACARVTISRASGPTGRSTPASTSSRPPGWSAAHEAQARHPDRPGRLPHRPRLAARRSTRSRGSTPPIPRPRTGFADFTVRLEPEKPWRRCLRPSVAIKGDYIARPTPRRCRSPTACSRPKWA